MLTFPKACGSLSRFVFLTLQSNSLVTEFQKWRTLILRWPEPLDIATSWHATNSLEFKLHSNTFWLAVQSMASKRIATALVRSAAAVSLSQAAKPRLLLYPFQGIRHRSCPASGSKPTIYRFEDVCNPHLTCSVLPLTNIKDQITVLEPLS